MKNVLLTLLLAAGFARPPAAQVPVREEPRHPPVFENAYVRLLDARLTPGDTTLYHLHETPSIYTTITPADLIVQRWGEAPQPWSFTAGPIWYADHRTQPSNHRLWNVDTVTLHIIDAEILGRGSWEPPAIDDLPGAGRLLDNEFLRAYTLELPPGGRLRLPASPALLIALTPAGRLRVKGGSGKRILAAGDFRWCDGRRPLRLANAGREAVRAAFYQWK